MRKRSWLMAITGLCLLALSASSTAQKKTAKEFTEEEKEAIRQERMQRLIMAQDLEALGRKKDAPELLIAAASILRSLAEIPEMNKPKVANVKPEIEGEGTAEVDEELPPLTLSEQSERLFKDASDMALNKNVDELIKLIKSREDREERSPVGGPKHVHRAIGGGRTHSFKFNLVNHTPTFWVFQSNIPLHVSVVRRDDSNAWFLHTTMHAARTFHPIFNPKAKKAPITIRVKNLTKKTAQYQFVLQ